MDITPLASESQRGSDHYAWGKTLCVALWVDEGETVKDKQREGMREEEMLNKESVCLCKCKACKNFS